MRKMLTVLGMAAVLVACGDEQGAKGAAGQAEPAEPGRSLTTTPALPPPTLYTDWDGKNFVPAGATSFFTLVTRGLDVPRDGSHSYLAFGIEVRTQQIVFRIAVAGDTQLAAFRSRIAAEISKAEQQNLDPRNAFWDGSLGQITLPPPPPPPDGPNGDGWIASKLLSYANSTYAANQQFYAPQ